MTTDTVKVLKGLEKVEISLGKIYSNLAKKEAFSKPVRMFWASIAEEEVRHSDMFRQLRLELEANPSLDFSIDLDWDRLRVFADHAREALARARADDITESEAYSLGARIEAELNESRFLRLAATGKPEIQKKIARIEAEARKHMMVMANYAKGVK